MKRYTNDKGQTGVIISRGRHQWSTRWLYQDDCNLRDREGSEVEEFLSLDPRLVRFCLIGAPLREVKSWLECNNITGEYLLRAWLDCEVVWVDKGMYFKIFEEQQGGEYLYKFSLDQVYKS